RGAHLLVMAPAQAPLAPPAARDLSARLERRRAHAVGPCNARAGPRPAWTGGPEPGPRAATEHGHVGGSTGHRGDGTPRSPEGLRHAPRRLRPGRRPTPWLASRDLGGGPGTSRARGPRGRARTPQQSL